MIQIGKDLHAAVVDFGRLWVFVQIDEVLVKATHHDVICFWLHVRRHEGSQIHLWIPIQRHFVLDQLMSYPRRHRE